MDSALGCLPKGFEVPPSVTVCLISFFVFFALIDLTSMRGALVIWSAGLIGVMAH